MSEWVKCSERLPERSDNYLCIRFEGDYGSTLYFSVDHKGWNIGFDGERTSEIFVTHWMPLPNPPTEEA